MPDVNVLVYAHRADERTHAAYRSWIEALVNGPEPFGMSVLVATAFVRIVTDRRIYPMPTAPSVALAAMDQLASHPGCRLFAPRDDHWSRLAALCRATGVTGKLVANVQHAAVAISAGCTWVTGDSDFSRFAPHGLRWQHLALDTPPS